MRRKTKANSVFVMTVKNFHKKHEFFEITTLFRWVNRKTVTFSPFPRSEMHFSNFFDQKIIIYENLLQNDVLVSYFCVQRNCFHHSMLILFKICQKLVF